MKYSLSILLFAAGLIAVSRAHALHPSHDADAAFLVKQKALFELVQHPRQVDLQPALHEVANAWKFEEHYDQYDDVDAVKYFVRLHEHHLIDDDEVFSVYNPVHLVHLKSLFNVFFYAKDWDAFYNSALWARFHVNHGLFVQALTGAVVHRRDLQGLQLPIVYELQPHFFFNAEVIQHAQQLKQQGFHGLKKVEGVYNVIVQANYTGADVHVTDDQRLSYFTEDIGLNAFYYYLHVDYPFWLGGKDVHLHKDRRGEFYMFVHQQLLARYYLERLSNDLGHIPEFTWWTPIESGYYPHLQTPQGHPFSPRENGHVVYQDNNRFTIDGIFIQESRLWNAIEWGYALLPNGQLANITAPEAVDVVGNLVQGNPDSVNPRYYSYFDNVHSTFGPSFGRDHARQGSVFPSVLQHEQTQLRDPGYWQWLKRVSLLWAGFNNRQPPYTVDEIGFNGVHIDSLEVEKLTTYFDLFDADITNAVDVEAPTEGLNWSELHNFGRVSHHNGHDFVIKARQRRLTHVPFKVSVRVTSTVAAPSVVRIFLGPKYDDGHHVIGLNENRQNFVQLDVFKYDLQVGNNNIERDSSEFIANAHDRTTSFELYKWVMGATKGEQTFTLDNSESHSGFPNRLVLPKGKKGGQLYTLFVHIAPYKKPADVYGTGFDNVVSSGIGSGARWIDGYPFGYPLNRPIDVVNWNTENMFYYDVNIFHKKENEINRTN